MAVLPSSCIPTSMWNGDRLYVPPVLQRVYKEELESRGLYGQSLVHEPGGVYGGATQEETERHFSQRFLVSAGRAIYCLCAPCEGFREESDALLALFSYGRVSLLDIPCGTGAFSIALISTLIELRSNNVLPKLPLTISIHSGDYSDHSRDICCSLLARLVDEAAKVGININYKMCEWDAYNEESTDVMFDDWMKSTSESSDHVVSILNFSGDLQEKKSFDDFSPSLRYIIARLYRRNGLFIWLEPTSANPAKRLRSHLKLLFKLIKCIQDIFGTRFKDGADGVTYSMHHPFTGAVMPSGVAREMFYLYPNG